MKVTLELSRQMRNQLADFCTQQANANDKIAHKIISDKRNEHWRSEATMTKLVAHEWVQIANELRK